METLLSIANSTISNHKFLLNVKNSKLYKIRVINDLSVDCLSGSQLKSLFESDINFYVITGWGDRLVYKW